MSEVSRRGYSVSFVTQPSKGIPTECPVCLNILFKPVMVTCCNRHFCSECITTIERAGEPSCPLCGQKRFTLVQDKGLERTLNDFEVYCPNRNKGCDWKGRLGECDNHLGIHKSFCHFEERVGDIKCTRIATSSTRIYTNTIPNRYTERYENLRWYLNQSDQYREKQLPKQSDDTSIVSLLLATFFVVSLLLFLPVIISLRVTTLRAMNLYTEEVMDDIRSKLDDITKNAEKIKTYKMLKKLRNWNTLSRITTFSDRYGSTELQCAVIDTKYHTTMPTCDLASDFGLEVYKSPDMLKTDHCSVNSDTFTQYVEVDIRFCTTKGADSCSCICTCVVNDCLQDVQCHIDSTKDRKSGTVDYNVIIHLVIAILLMSALLRIGKYQQLLKNLEVKEHNIMTMRDLSTPAYLHDKRDEMHLFTSGIPSISSYFHCANNIAGVPFIGEVEVLACDSWGCEYWNPDHDITVRIPPGAIPLGVTIQLEVAVALYGPFQFPNNSSPISPILWLCNQKEIVFRKPIEIILPHFVSSIKNFDINFAKADHKWYSVDELGMKQYVFKQVDTAFINIKEGTRNYGHLSVNHCCYFCITADNSFSSDLALKAGYCFWCIEKPLSPLQSRDMVLLCTTFFLSTCRTALKLQYPTSEGYRIHEPIIFKFQNPEDGSEPYILVSIQDEKCVVAANPPSRKIAASQVYFWNQSAENLKQMHEERIYPPKITLMLELTKSCSTKPVPIQICISGAQNELDKEVLLPLGNTVQHHSPINYVGKWLSTGRPEVRNLLIELRSEVAHEWEDLGILLGIEPNTLDALKTTENNTAQSRLREMLKIWQKRINPPPSWSAVVVALEYMNYQGLASDLKHKYNC